MRRCVEVCLALLLTVACAPATPKADPPRFPDVPAAGGPMLATARLVLVTFASDARKTELTSFADWLVTARFMPDEYGLTGLTRGPDVTLPQSAPATLTLAEVRALLAPTLSAGDLVVLYTPDGTSVTDLAGNLCRNNPGTGTHDSDDQNRPFVVIPSCPPRFSSILSRDQAMELDTARLVVNALTNPAPRNAPALGLTDTSSPWTALGSEVGDFCWGRLWEPEAGRHLQRIWSNQRAAQRLEPCWPSKGGGGFGVTVEPQTLQRLRVGETLRFTVTAWASAPLPAWSVSAAPWSGDFTQTVELDRDVLGDGQKAGLSLTVPFDVPAGSAGAVLIRSTARDEVPVWPVTFFVQP